jgi:hypothetical protein
LAAGCAADFAAGFGGAAASPKVTGASSFSAAFGTARVAEQDTNNAAAKRQCNRGLMGFLMAKT